VNDLGNIASTHGSWYPVDLQPPYLGQLLEATTILTPGGTA